MLITSSVSLQAEVLPEDGLTINVSGNNITFKKEVVDYGIVGVELYRGKEKVEYGAEEDKYSCTFPQIPENVDWSYRLNFEGYTFAFLFTKKAGAEANGKGSFNITYNGVTFPQTLSFSTVKNGDQGPQGEPGKDGTSVRILGSLDSKSDLPPSGNIGDGYLINGELYVWTGSAWMNVGKIQGPAGDSAYVHIAYANFLGPDNIDLDSFSFDNPNGRDYIGLYADNVPAGAGRDQWRKYTWRKYVGPQGDGGLSFAITGENVLWDKEDTETIVGIDLYSGNDKIPYGDGLENTFKVSGLTVPANMSFQTSVNHPDFTFAYILKKSAGIAINTSLPFTIKYKGKSYRRSINIKTVLDGKPGVKGAGPRFSVWEPGVDYLCGDGEEKFYDVVEFDNGDGKRHYLCKKSHRSKVGENPVYSIAHHLGLWEETKMWDLLLAERIAADRIDTDGLVVNELQTYVDPTATETSPFIYMSKGLQRIIGGGCEFQFGFDDLNRPVLRYIQNGKMIYDLGPNGIHYLKQAKFIEKEIGFVSRLLPEASSPYVGFWTACEHPLVRTAYEFEAGEFGSNDNGRLYQSNDMSGDHPRDDNQPVADGWYAVDYSVPAPQTVINQPTRPQYFNGNFTPNRDIRCSYRTLYQIWKGMKTSGYVMVYWVDSLKPINPQV